MVEKEEFDGDEAYYCDCCGLHYEKKETAEECEMHCKQRNVCQQKVTKKSIERS